MRLWPVRIACLLALVACGGEDEARVGDDDFDWEAKSADDDRESTHLWIVGRALQGLEAHRAQPEVASLLGAMRAPQCLSRWRAGLLDADYKKEFNNGRTDLDVDAGMVETLITGATWESHFWDPDTNQNYKERSTPTAKTESSRHAAEAKRLFARDRGAACYELGLALHYFTDLTHPMHAANFTNVDTPLKLHSNYEHFAMDLHATRSIPTSVRAPAGGASADAVFVSTAKKSKAGWEPLFGAVSTAYRANCPLLRWGTLGLVDFPSCWEGEPRIEELTRGLLRDAVQSTATYLVALDLR